MQAYQCIFMGLGGVIAAFGLWGLLTVPRLYAKHAADVASREPVMGEVVGYELDSEDATYTRLIEYEVDGHRYRMRGWDTVAQKGELRAPVRLAYRRDMRSDAIEVEREFSGDKLTAKIAIGTGVVIFLTGFFG